MARHLKGIRRSRSGWQTYVRIHGEYHSQTWPLSTSLAAMRSWIDEQRATYANRPEVGGTFAATVASYLERVAAMPTIDQRTTHLKLWLHELGRTRAPDSITPTEIDSILQIWLETLAPGTVRKRRTALRSFFSKMYPRLVNPVKGSTNPKEPKPEVRSLSYALIDQAIAAMPDYRTPTPRAPRMVNLGKVRAAVIAYTGLPPGVLQRIRPEDLDLHSVPGRVRVVPRTKGGGIEARTLPLSAEGLAAFKAFHQANAYGRFATPALNASVKRAFKRIGLARPVRLYDLRHSFLTELYRVTHDLATVGRLGLHAEGSVITARYAKGAHDEVDAAAVAAFDAGRSTARQAALKVAIPVQQVTKKLHAKVARIGKVR
jgi:integrase